MSTMDDETLRRIAAIKWLQPRVRAPDRSLADARDITAADVMDAASALAAEVLALRAAVREWCEAEDAIAALMYADDDAFREQRSELGRRRDAAHARLRALVREAGV